MKNQDLVRKIIEENSYLTLGTCNEGVPWIAPLAYVHDAIYNFYFVSPSDSLHAGHILSNQQIAFAIFDSQQAVGTGVGIQASGICEAVLEEGCPMEVKEYLNGLKQLPINLDRYLIFRISSVRFFVPNLGAWEKNGIDSRTEVKLSVI